METVGRFLVLGFRRLHELERLQPGVTAYSTQLRGGGTVIVTRSEHGLTATVQWGRVTHELSPETAEAMWEFAAGQAGTET